MNWGDGNEDDHLRRCFDSSTEPRFSCSRSRVQRDVDPKSELSHETKPSGNTGTVHAATPVASVKRGHSSPQNPKCDHLSRRPQARTPTHPDIQGAGGSRTQHWGGETGRFKMRKETRPIGTGQGKRTTMGKMTVMAEKTEMQTATAARATKPTVGALCGNGGTEESRKL